MRDLALTFIGTGNAFAPGGLCWNGFVADGRYLFETPPQALMALNKLEQDPNQLEAVVISHHHGDHFLGLPFLLLHWKHRGRTEPLHIVGPPETREIARDVCARVYPGIWDVDYGLEWVEAKPGERIAIGDLELDPVEVKHDPKLNLNLGFGCRLDGRTFAYTGDTALCDAVLDLAREHEIVVAECASATNSIPIHMNLRDDIPKLRAVMDPGASLILTHVVPDVRPAGLDRTWVAEDYATYTL